MARHYHWFQYGGQDSRSSPWLSWVSTTDEYQLIQLDIEVNNPQYQICVF
jgi:hypothetical protein